MLVVVGVVVVVVIVVVVVVMVNHSPKNSPGLWSWSDSLVLHLPCPMYILV